MVCCGPPYDGGRPSQPRQASSVWRTFSPSSSSSFSQPNERAQGSWATITNQQTMWALASLLRLLPSLVLLLVLSTTTTTTNAAVIPFDHGAGSQGEDWSSVRCRPRLSGLVQQIRKSGDRESPALAPGRLEECWLTDSSRTAPALQPKSCGDRSLQPSHPLREPSRMAFKQ